MDIQGRIEELAKAAGVVTGVNPQQCWVDSKVRCPYGTPEGSYIWRPLNACNDSCKTFVDAKVVFSSGNEDTIVREYFDDQHVSTTSELRARAEEVAKGSPERLTLLLAAEIIEHLKLDQDILLREDLPGTI